MKPRTFVSALYAVIVVMTFTRPAPAETAPREPGEPPMDRLFENRLEPESAEYLSIHLFDVAVDAKKAADPANFTVVSPDDADYAEASAIRPGSSGSRTRAARVAVRRDLLVKETAIFLKLPKPMKSGKVYGVRVGDIGAAAIPELRPVRFDDRRQINDNIRLNQLGYLPDYEKRAYLGQYMGDLGPMPIAAESFEVLGADGKSVFSGKVTKRGVGDELVGQTVYDLDFTAFKTPGTYRVFVPGVGLSTEFRFGDGALNPLYANLMRGHYHQRCGHAVDPAFSRHHRDACHLDDAFVEAEAAKTNFTTPKNPPYYPTRYDGRRQKATGGHHDAGDYGKYTITGAAYVFSALHAMAVFPDRFREDNLGLPYSGTGVPDVLEEVKWELDWLENMQDESDGGVFGVIRPKTGGYEHMLPPKESHRLFFPKDTVFTAAYAGALAHAAASPVMREHFPKDCERYLAKARRAWEFLEKNQRFVQYFHYGAEFGDWDERCWAAAELYAATGEQPFHDYFLKNFNPAKRRWDWWPLFEAVGYATHRYGTLTGRDVDAAMVEKCKAEIRDACAMHLRFAKESPYRMSMPEPSIRHGNYGWLFPGDFAAYDLLMGYALEQKPEYLQVALDNLNYECGANPSGHFLQTGLGAKRNIEVVSDQSGADGIIEPVPGLPLGIGSAGIYFLNQYGKRPAEGQHPDHMKWPLLNRWYDGFNVSTEFTMGPMMRETIAAGFFASLAKSENQERPVVKITADKMNGPAPLAVKFDAQVQPAGREIVQVFWDFGDESFSVQRSPTHMFRDAGRQYPVAVTVVDASGQSAYAETEVLTTVSDAQFAQTPFDADDQTLLLYHFDKDLKDAGKHGIALKADAKKASERKPHSFAAHGPAWMARPSGSCLVLDGAEQFTATIPPELLPEPAKTPLTIEMMLYLQEFAGWGYDGDPMLLGLKTDWDSMLGWRQETWDKANAPKFGEVTSERFAKEFPRNRWCNVKIVYDGKGAAMLLVDGKAWGKHEGPLFNEQAKNKPVVFTIGPFRGMVDEVRVRTGADETKTADAK